MYSQFFGSYLLNHGLVSAADLTAAFEKKHDTRLKLGTLAINEGLMDAAQVERVNIAQQSVDKRFGDLAVELGYLTKDDVERLLTKQPADYLTLGQALVNNGALSNDDFEKAIKDYKEEYTISDDDVTETQSDTLTGLIEDFYHFGRAENAKISTDYVTMLLKNIIRFVGDDFTPLESFVVSSFDATNIVKQPVEGEKYKAVTCICCGRAEYKEVAKRFTKEDFADEPEFISAAVGELLNVVNGLFVVNESNENGMELTMQPQEFVEGGKISFEKPAFCIPVVFSFGEVDFIICAG